MISCSNHKSATIPSNDPTLIKNYTKEVDIGWMLPVTIKSVLKIKGAVVIPVGCATQFSINKDGDRYTKQRTTHDSSFAPPSGNSVNERIHRELLTECFYGHCLLRFLHAIHITLWTYSGKRIFITKLDLDAAYCWLHVIAAMIVLTVTILKKIAYILLRLPFGVVNGPNNFSLLSEPIMDLTNDILRDKEWDPTEIHSPLQPEFDTMNEQYDNDIPFVTANKLFVPMPFYPAMADGYIDDIVTVMLDQVDWV